MRELLDSILDVIRLAGPLNTVLFLLVLAFILLLITGIYKKGVEKDTPKDDSIRFVMEIEDHSCSQE